MNNVAKDIFRAIHEGKWLFVEYQNSSEEITKYWIAINSINIEKKSLTVTGLHIGSFLLKELSLYIERILCTKIIDGTFYKTNKALLDDIESSPSKYAFLFTNTANLKILNYLADCNKLADLPRLNTQYSLVKKLDSEKLEGHFYKLTDEQYKMVINSFKKVAEIQNEKDKKDLLQLALNVLSIHTSKGLYVLAYKEIRFDVCNKMLITGNSIKICKEFSMEGNFKLSIHNFIDGDELSLLDDFENNAEIIKDLITRNISKRTDYSVDDRPYFICLQRDINLDLDKEYQAIVQMYADSNPSVPVQAFFGELRFNNANNQILPITLINRNTNLDQLLAIHNAINNNNKIQIF